MPAPSAADISAVSASRDIIVPVGLAGLPTRTPLSGALRWAASNASPVSAWRVSLGGLDQHRLAAERGQDVTVRRIAGHGNRDAVAGLEHREKGQDERAGRAGRDHDPRGVDVTAIGIAVMPRDALAQRGDAERRGVVDPTEVECPVRGRDRGFRRGRRRLAYLHVNDMTAGRLDPRGRAHHVHHHERRNIAADGGRKQVRHALPQCRFTHGYLLFRPPNLAVRRCSAGAPD